MKQNRATQTRTTLNAEIPSAVLTNIRAEVGDCKTVGTVKRSRYASTCIEWIPWNNRDCEAVYVVKAIVYLLYWLYIYARVEIGHNEIPILSQIWPWSQGQPLPKQ